MSKHATNAGATRLLIIDDHRMFVDSLVRLLSDEPDLVVVGAAHTIDAGLRIAHQHSPDVVLLDYRLPDGDAPICIAGLREILPGARVLVMTGLGDDATLAAARDAGCAGVVTKDRAARDLVEAVRAVAAGAPINQTDAPEPHTPQRPRSSIGYALSPREREILALLATGETTAEIAASLHIRAVTVRNHIQHLMAKLDAHSRLEAVALGIEAGFIAPPPHRPRAS